MRIITTIRDLENLVDSYSGSEGLADENGTHEQNVSKVAGQIRDEAHREGLRYGQDWSEFLSEIKPVWEYL